VCGKNIPLLLGGYGGKERKRGREGERKRGEEERRGREEERKRGKEERKRGEEEEVKIEYV